MLGGTLLGYGFFQSTQTFSGLIFLLPAAFFSDKFGHRKVVIIGSVAFTLSMMIITFTPIGSWQLLILGAIGLGASRALVDPSIIAIIAHENKEDRIKVFTYLEFSRWSSLAVGYFASAGFFLLNNNLFTYPLLQGTMFVTFVFYLLSVIPCLLLENTKNAEDQTEANFVESFENGKKKRNDGKGNFLEFLRSKPGIFVLGFAFISLLVGFGAGFLVPFAQPYWVTRFGFGPSEVNLYMGISQIVTAACMMAVPLLARRFGDARTIIITQGLSIPLALMLAFSSILPISTFAFFSRIALMNMSRPAQTAILQNNIPHDRRAVTASLMTVGDRIGRSVSPSLSPILIDQTGDFAVSFSITAVMYTIAVSGFYVLKKSTIDRLQMRSLKGSDND